MQDMQTLLPAELLRGPFSFQHFSHTVSAKNVLCGINGIMLKKKKHLEKCLPFQLALPAEEILTLLAIMSFSVVQNLFNFQVLLPGAELDFQESL